MEITPAAKSFIPAFFEGLFVPWTGWNLMQSNRKLWVYGWAPVLLNILISALMIWLLYVGGSALFSYVLPSFPEGVWGWILQGFAVLGIAVVALALVVAVWLILSSILCGFFYSRLARQVELLLGAQPSDLTEVPLLYEITYALRTAGLILVINGGLLLFHLIPVVGSAVSLVGSFYFNCYLFGWEYFDYPLALRAQTYTQKKAFAKSHRFHTLGMGAAVLGFTFIPILGAVFLTTAVAGSVMLHRRIQLIAPR